MARILLITGSVCSKTYGMPSLLQASESTV
jgi:hypothetical protein